MFLALALNLEALALQAKALSFALWSKALALQFALDLVVLYSISCKYPSSRRSKL